MIRHRIAKRAAFGAVDAPVKRIAAADRVGIAAEADNIVIADAAILQHGIEKQIRRGVGSKAPNRNAVASVVDDKIPQHGRRRIADNNAIRAVVAHGVAADQALRIVEQNPFLAVADDRVIAQHDAGGMLDPESGNRAADNFIPRNPRRRIFDMNAAAADRKSFKRRFAAIVNIHRAEQHCLPASRAAHAEIFLRNREIFSICSGGNANKIPFSGGVNRFLDCRIGPRHIERLRLADCLDLIRARVVIRIRMTASRHQQTSA